MENDFQSRRTNKISHHTTTFNTVPVIRTPCYNTVPVIRTPC